MSWNKITEQQNPRSSNIDTLSVAEILGVINREDAEISIAVEKALPILTKFTKKVVYQFQKNGRLFYVGSGTSGRLGVLDAVECPPTFSSAPEMVQGIIAGGYGALVQSIEGAEDSREEGAKAVSDFSVNKNDVFLGISASSNTPFVLGALEEAHKTGASTGLLVCNHPPKISYIDYIISIITGPEVITGSTRMKAGTATKMALNMITTTAMIKMNKTYGNLMVDLKASNVKLCDRGTRIIQQITDLSYDEAFTLLKSADREVKTALVMNKRGVSKLEAQGLLQEVSGQLVKVI